MRKRTGGVHFCRYWLPAILWMGVIFWMSTGTFSSEHTSRFIVPLLHFLFPGLHPEELDLIHELIRKCGHAAEYFVLGLLLFRAFRGGAAGAWRPLWAVSALAGAALFALSDEFHQALVASRNFSLLDVGIDSLGALLSQLALARVAKGAGRDAGRRRFTGARLPPFS